MSPENILEKINNDLQDKKLETTLTTPRRIQVKAQREQLYAVLAYLKAQFGLAHLGTITGVDLGENFELIYHLSSADTTVNVRILTPRSNPTIPSVCSLIPGAVLYERELQDMFGIVVEDIPDGRRLLLCDDWPDGQYPLRKDWNFERPAEVIPGGE